MADTPGPDTAQLVAAAERALAPVIADLERACDIPASIWIATESGYPTIWVSNGRSSGYAGTPMDENPEVAKAEMADYVQGQLMDQDIERFWPSCLEHGRGLHAEVREGAAVWFCRGGEHAVAAIGHLGQDEPAG